MVDYIKGMNNAFTRGYSLALLQATIDAERLAKRNATRQFTGRRNRKLSGRLLNSIYSGFTEAGGMPQSFIGTKGIPYGAVHEYGHDGIKPVKAQHLWVKMWGGAADKFRRMTPTDFIKEMRNSKAFQIFRSKAGNLLAFHVVKISGKKVKYKLTPLFHLRDEVKIKERPYLRPAIEEAFEDFGGIAAKRIAQELVGIR